MQRLADETGTLYDLVNVGNNKVKLQSKKFPEINHIYKQDFIEGAIKDGLLIEIPQQKSFLKEKPPSDLTLTQEGSDRGNR